MGDGSRYALRTIDRLVAGWIIDDAGRPLEAAGQWAAIRSYTEHHGNVESEAWLEVLDLERAIAALWKEHPLAAMAVTATLMGAEEADIKVAFANLRTPYATTMKKATAFLAAFLSGDVDRFRRAQSAYRRARRGELTPFD